MSGKIVQLNEQVIKTELKELVRQSVQEVHNSLLDAEADQLTNARKYQRTEGRPDTRVEVHLSDENSDKKFGTEEKRCLLEARLSGLPPLVVSHQAATVEQAVDGAVDQLVSSIDTTLGKLDNQ